MKGPVYNIKKNGEINQTSPSWVVAFFPFLYSQVGFSVEGGDASKIPLKKPIIVLNDAIEVQVGRQKGSHIKTANVSLKAGEIDYMNIIRSGDYMCIWMHNWPEDSDRIYKILRGEASGSLNDFKSGLKFVGKIKAPARRQNILPSGSPYYTVDITGSMFDELNMSVYISRYVETITKSFNAKGELDSANSSDNFLQLLSPEKYLDFFKVGDRRLGGIQQLRTPDEVIRFLLSVFLGAGPSEKTKTVNGALKDDNNVGQQKGSFNDAIIVPQEISTVLGGPRSQTNYISLLNCYTGLEKYRSGNIEIDSSLLVPNTATPSGVFFQSAPLKGNVVVRAAPWENVPFFPLLKNWLNPTINEMYTSMRYSPATGIRPSITARQIPFSTNLFDRLSAKNVKFLTSSGLQKIDIDVFTSRTHFNNLPRWVIDPALTNSINVGADSDSHYNFVQVYGVGFIDQLTGLNINSEELKASIRLNDLAAKNYVADKQDIKKHGLKAAIMTCPHDIMVTQSGKLRSIAPLLSAFQADFLFNSQLKWSGRVSMKGIQEPIAEGDNAEIDGVLYHIEGVTDLCRIDTSSGKKEFVTILTLSNGILAESLDSTNPNRLPEYPDQSPSKIRNNFGITDIQKTRHTNRNKDGLIQAAIKRTVS